jgi:SSS family solute:Na+ symporter
VAFYRRVLPTVYGWKHIAKLAPDLPEVRDVSSNAFNWVMGVILVYGCLFGIGKLIFQQWFWGAVLLVVAGIAGYLIFWDLSRRGWATLSGTEVGASPGQTHTD